MRRGTLVLGLLLALTACSATVTVPLPDQTLDLPDLPGLIDTGGKVVYPKDGLSFAPPSVDVVRGIRVEGVLEASEPLNATLEFYARTRDPSQDSACTAPLPGVDIYLCSIGPDDQKVGQATFQNSQQASFTLQGTKLTEGIKAGRLWLGIKASGLPSDPITLTFLNMKAYVTVGL